MRQPEQTPNGSLATSGNPDNNQWTAGFTYDVLGNVISMTDAKNTTITNEYDKAGRPTKRTYSDGTTPQAEYFYDGTGLPSVPQFSRGALTKVTSSVSEDRFTSFDNQRRLLASQQITDGQTYDFQYKYNLSGGLAEETYPSGRIVRNFLDTDGGLSSVTSKTISGMTKVVASNFDYSAAGDIRKMRLGNGLWETAQANERLQMTQVGLGTTTTNNDLFKVDYEYGELNVDGTTVDTAKNIGNIAKTTTTIPTTNFIQTFKYDAINRLTEAKEKTSSTTNWHQTFGYDRFGNRNARYQIIGGNVLPTNNLTLPTIDQTNNRFTTGQGYVYDLNGNLVQDAEGRTFTFNGDDKQTQIYDSVSGQTTQYFYDGSGARVKKHNPSTGETTIFVYDAGGALAAEYSTATPPANPTTSYMTTDHLGSPRVITDGTGNVVSRRDFMPFGEELGAGIGPRTTNLKYSVTGSDNVRQRFTGYEKDEESGLDFAEARMYQNKHGRFTAVDPLMASASPGNPQTFNRYTYTGNNPVNYTDHSGLCVDRKTQEDDGQPCKDYSGQVYLKDGVYWNGPIDGGVAYNGPSITREAYGKTYQITGGANGGYKQIGPQDSTVAVTAGSEAVVNTSAAEIATSVSSRPLDGLPACPVEKCGSITNSSPSLDTSKNEPLATVAAIKSLAQLIQFVPGANVAGATIETAINVGQGNGVDAGIAFAGVVPGLSWLRKADKVVDGARAGTKLLNSAPARLTQESLEHIVSRHWATSGAKGAGTFLEGTTARGLRRLVETASTKGVFSANTLDRPGTIAIYDFGKTIGRNAKGRLRTSLKVVINPNGTVKTAFPY